MSKKPAFHCRPAAACLIAGAMGASLVTGAALAADKEGAIPDFSSHDMGWTSNSVVYQPVAGEKYAPVYALAGHPFCGNSVQAACGNVLTVPIGDYTNPILQPWAAEAVKKSGEDILSGKQSFESMSRCWPGGVPGMLLFTAEPTYYLQMPKEVTILYSRGPNIRDVYMDAPHTKDPKPTWLGESVGHYEGDTLVVDTIGQNDKTFVDWFHVPHTTKMHVVERYRYLEKGEIYANNATITQGGPMLEAVTTVDDPGTFTAPWSGRRTFAERHTPIAASESICAENNDSNYFHEDEAPVPQTETPDF